MIPSRAAPIQVGSPAAGGMTGVGLTGVGLTVRAAGTDADLSRIMAMRARVFRGGQDDRDAFDDACCHVLIEGASLLACFRLLPMATGKDIAQSYSAARYDLSALQGFDAPILELGRFCIAPDCTDPSVLRLAWAFITREVDARGAGMLCGCTSFNGTDPVPHLPAFAMLRSHLAPAQWAPRAKGADHVSFDNLPACDDPRAGLAGIPALLRTYLGMGGWVSDHAVPDPDLNTLHVFTAVEIAAIPPARARALRALAQSAAS